MQKRKISDFQVGTRRPTMSTKDGQDLKSTNPLPPEENFGANFASS
jgi:hypothetical protein